MRIVNIITDLDTGGTEISLRRLLSRLSPQHHPHVISLSTIGDVGKEIEKIGVPVEALGMKPGFPDLLSLIRLTRKLKALRPDAVHTWMYHADLIGGLAARIAGVPAISWAIRNTDLSVDKTKWTTRAVVHVCAMLSRKIPDRIVSCSYAARDIHIKLGYDATRFVVIPNGFDLAQFRPDPVARSQIRYKLGISSNVFLIGLVARFDPLKNHKGFIEAAGILHTKRPIAHFILAGQGLDAGNLELASWIRRAGIEKVTHLMGRREDIHRLTAAFDIATSFSWGEAFSNVVGEAMACGVPCVVTDVGDSAQIVSDTGFVIAPGDIHGLAAIWDKLLAWTPEERQALGVRARSYIHDNFDLGIVVQRYEAFYKELTTKARDNRKCTR